MYKLVTEREKNKFQFMSTIPRPERTVFFHCDCKPNWTIVKIRQRKEKKTKGKIISI